MLYKLVILQYIPLELFVVLFRFFKYDWPAVFIISGICALLFLVVLLRQKNLIDRFLLAIYYFLIGGAAMFIFNIDWLQAIYQYFDKAMLLVWLLVVGVFSIFMTPAGLIGVESIYKQKQRLYSYYLLGAAAIGLFVALYDRESVLFAATLPFMSVRILQIILSRLLIRQK